MYYKELRENLFAEISYPKRITELISNAEPWKEFCSLPINVKEQFQLLNQVRNGDDGDVGYQLRSHQEGREDKEYFHIYPNSLSLVKGSSLEKTLENPTIRDFFEYANTVSNVVHDFALSVGKEIGEKVPGLTSLIEQGEIHSTLRLLHYMNSDDTHVAAQHFDRSLYTLHLYESAPGLQFLNWDMSWEDAPIRAGKTVVFNGYRMEQLTKGGLQKTWHRVINKGVRDRISLVLFVWSNAVPSYDQEARSQEMIPSYIKL